MIVALNIVFLVLVCWWMSGHSAPYDKLWFWLTLGLKVIAGIVLGLIYMIYLQSGDTLLYFREASEIVNSGDQSLSDYLKRLFTSEHPQYKGEYRTEFFAKILSFFVYITGGNYWLSAIYLSIISFAGTWSLARTLMFFDEKLKWPALIGLMLIPSVIFWSSGVLKDAVANACFFYLCTFLIRFYDKKPMSFADHLFYAFALIMLIKLRFYLGAVVLFFIGYLLIRNLVVRYVRPGTIKYLIYLGVISALLIGVSYMDYNLQFNHLPQSIHLNYQSIFESSKGTNCITFNLSPDWWGIVRNFPKSLLYGLIGPLPGQGPITSIVYWLENCLLILLFLYNINLMIRHRTAFERTHLLLPALGYILIMATLLPLAAPNFGTLMRYKSAFLPYLWILLLYYPFQRFFPEKST